MQNLASIIEDVTSRLRQGRFPNEQSISQGIVLRLLHQLGWDVYDPTSVWPEYNTGEGRVDFALCHPPSRPAVFIEVKQPGKAESGIRQALEYAFHTGVPFVVLTDGKTWSFHLADGSWPPTWVISSRKRLCAQRLKLPDSPLEPTSPLSFELIPPPFSSN